MNKAFLIYPNQLFKELLLIKDHKFFLIEDPLFFSQYKFHKKKLILHRASMKAFFESHLNDRNCRYVNSNELKDSADIQVILNQEGINEVSLYDPTDNWLLKKISTCLNKQSIKLNILESPNFLSTKEQAETMLGSNKKFYFTSFYIEQRKRLAILLNKDQSPKGGHWTYDTENRKKLPKNHIPTKQPKQNNSKHVIEATSYVENLFKNNPGNTDNFFYPISHKEAETWLKIFISKKLALFGDFEDAVSVEDQFIYHSVLSPILNIGLLSPADIVNHAINEKEVPLNSLEGFIRQIIGWREYVRIIYLKVGVIQRTKNFWEFSNPLPNAYWTGNTGIDPVDHAIKNVLNTGYSHHIERLMILGNFMLLSEYHPDRIYEWFMEMYIDAYDWVMVPNVYGMSQFADGGLITTKPYISSSNYVKKMGDYKSGPWCEIWDGLFWRFIGKRYEFFKKNPRLSMMAVQYDRMTNEKKEKMLKLANDFSLELNIK